MHLVCDASNTRFRTSCENRTTKRGERLLLFVTRKLILEIQARTTLDTSHRTSEGAAQQFYNVGRIHQNDVIASVARAYRVSPSNAEWGHRPHHHITPTHACQCHHVRKRYVRNSTGAVLPTRSDWFRQVWGRFRSRQAAMPQPSGTPPLVQRIRLSRRVRPRNYGLHKRRTTETYKSFRRACITHTKQFRGHQQQAAFRV